MHVLGLDSIDPSAKEIKRCWGQALTPNSPGSFTTYIRFY